MKNQGLTCFGDNLGLTENHQVQYHFVSATSYDNKGDTMKSPRKMVFFQGGLMFLVTPLLCIPALDFPLKKGRQQIILLL